MASNTVTRSIFYRSVDFLTLNTLTQLYLKNLYTFRTNIVSRSYRIIKGLAPTEKKNSHLVVLRSEVTFFRPFLVYICFALSALVISFTPKFYVGNLKKKKSSFRLNKLGVQSRVPIRYFSS